MEVVAEKTTIVKVSKETSVEIVLKEAVSKVVDLIINTIYHHRSLNERSAIYMGNLNAN